MVLMTKSYYYGKVETPKPKRVKRKKSHIPNDVINQDQVEYDQLQNKIIQDKIHETYVKAHEKLNQRVGWIVEASMRKHKKNEEDY